MMIGRFWEQKAFFSGANCSFAGRVNHEARFFFSDSIVGLGAISTLPRMTHYELKLVQTCQSSKSSCFKHILVCICTYMHIFVFFVSGPEYNKDFKFTGCFPWFPSSGLSWKCKPSRPQSNLWSEKSGRKLSRRKKHIGKHRKTHVFSL